MTVGCITPEQPLEPSQLSAEPSPANSPPNPTDQNTTKAGPVKELTPTDQNASRAEPVKELTPEQKQKALRDSVVGEYEYKDEDGTTYKYIYLENSVWELYEDGKKLVEHKWSIRDGEIHVIYESGLIEVYRYNKDKSITLIARIRDGERTDYTKELQTTLKKIK